LKHGAVSVGSGGMGVAPLAGAWVET